MANNFTCPVHHDRHIRGLSIDDRTFGCPQCLAEKPNHFIIKPISSQQEAKELIQTLFTDMFCQAHPQNQLQFYCHKHQQAICATCVTKCSLQAHPIQELQLQYEKTISTAQKLSDVIPIYLNDHLKIMTGHFHPHYSNLLKTSKIPKILSKSEIEKLQNRIDEVKNSSRGDAIRLCQCYRFDDILDWLQEVVNNPAVLMDRMRVAVPLRRQRSSSVAGDRSGEQLVSVKEHIDHG
eukprot:CAMPEP_0115025200 /NCGR_PEP_ID=MMETSP0216-20121206/33822_1 /TAXON_ID=223996 /ORGANISM="Protocruzia adherens, Strain Boccale" /LENGTH=235 /DNA_ID=CAMNT_0002399665 /DNA_START=71 /DNA_END=774 /DNA_ORIENTATION=-